MTSPFANGSNFWAIQNLKSLHIFRRSSDISTKYHATEYY